MKGKDGLVRAAKIRTAQGRTNRPIARLIPLEVSSDVANNSSTDEANTISPPDADSDHDTVERMSQPQRQAAKRGRHKVQNWIKQLGGPPEDLMD